MRNRPTQGLPLVLELALFLLVSGIAAFVFARRGLMKIHSVSVFAVTWCPILLLCSLSSSAQPRILQSTWNMVWIALAGVIIGTVVVSGTAARDDGRPPVLVNVQRLLKWHRVGLVLLLGYVALQLVKSRSLVEQAGGWIAVISTAGGDVRRASLASSIQATNSALDGGAALGGALNYVLFAGHITAFTGALLWKLRINRSLAVLPIILVAIYGVLSLQRTSLMMTMLLFVMALTAMPDRLESTAPPLRKRPPSKYGAPQVAAGLVVAGAGILIPLYSRNVGTKNATGFDSLLQYFVSGVLGLNARNTYNPAWHAPVIANEVAPDPGYGSYTLTNIFGVANRLGLPVPVAPNFYDYYYVSFGGARFATNTGTSIVDFYYDFGFVGIGVAFLVLAAAGTYFQRRARRGVVMYSPLAAYFLTAIAWSFFGSSVLADVRYALVACLAALALSRVLTTESRVYAAGMV